MTSATKGSIDLNPDHLPDPARSWRLPLALAVVLAIAVRVWAAAQWPANFQGDEAVFGLMARHILAGEFTPTLYGPAFLGSIESIIAAGFMSVFGPTVMAFRMSTLVLFAAFFVLHSVFASRYFGYPVAWVSLLFLALPGFHVLEWTYQPVGAYGAMFVIGTLMLLVASPDIVDGRARLLRAAAMGVLTGLGLWANNTMILYLVGIGIVAFLASPEWRAVYERLSKFCERSLLIALAEWLPVATIGVAGLGTLAFFSGACSPVGLFITVGSIAKMALIVLGLGLVASAISLSQRRRQLALEGAVVGTGFAAGYSPLLYQWVSKGIPPYWAVYPSCPEGAVARAKLLVKEILPALWGLPTIDQLKQLAAFPSILWVAVAVLTLAAFIFFFWENRVTVWRVFALTPLDSTTRPLSMIVLLFIVPIAITILAGNTVDLYSIRHALMTTQASALVSAVFLVWLGGKLRKLGVIVAAFWLLFGGLSNLAYANANWLVKFTRYAPQDVGQLQGYLEANNVKYGYADYWGAYTLDYLIEEKSLIAPFNGIDRYPPYSRAAASAPKLAFVFPTTNAPAPTGLMNDLKSFLADADNPVGEGAAYPRIRERLQAQVVTGVERIAAWDVWIVADQ